jgi:hypothetical protein
MSARTITVAALILGMSGVLCLFAADTADDQPRVFITDSQSREMVGHAAGGWNSNGGGFAASSHGGARPQTAEIIKTFGERCPQVKTNNKLEKADYVVVLDHEGGKNLLRHKNKVAVFNAASGDSIVSHSTVSLGGSVQEACQAIQKDWNERGAVIRAALGQAVIQRSATSSPAVLQMSKFPSAAKLSVASSPDGADIEVDGNFVGNTPSTLELPRGKHTVSVKKSGYSQWQRKVKLTGGEVRINVDLEKTH